MRRNRRLLRRNDRFQFRLRLAWCDVPTPGSAGGGAPAGGEAASPPAAETTAPEPKATKTESKADSSSGGESLVQEKAQLAAELEAERKQQAFELRAMKREVERLRTEKIDAEALEMLGLEDPDFYQHPFVKNAVSKAIVDGKLDRTKFEVEVKGLKELHPKWFGQPVPGGLPVSSGLRMATHALDKYVDDGGSKIWFRHGDLVMDRQIEKQNAARQSRRS